jgi:hypothetical protein
MVARLFRAFLALAAEPRSVDGIGFTAGVLLALAAYIYTTREPQEQQHASETCVMVPYHTGDRPQCLLRNAAERP